MPTLYFRCNFSNSFETYPATELCLELSATKFSKESTANTKADRENYQQVYRIRPVKEISDLLQGEEQVSNMKSAQEMKSILGKPKDDNNDGVIDENEMMNFLTSIMNNTRTELPWINQKFVYPTFPDESFALHLHELILPDLKGLPVVVVNMIPPGGLFYNEPVAGSFLIFCQPTDMEMPVSRVTFEPVDDYMTIHDIASVTFLIINIFELSFADPKARGPAKPADVAFQMIGSSALELFSDDTYFAAGHHKLPIRAGPIDLEQFIAKTTKLSQEPNEPDMMEVISDEWQKAGKLFNKASISLRLFGQFEVNFGLG